MEKEWHNGVTTSSQVIDVDGTTATFLTGVVCYTAQWEKSPWRAYLGPNLASQWIGLQKVVTFNVKLHLFCGSITFFEKTYPKIWLSQRFSVSLPGRRTTSPFIDVLNKIPKPVIGLAFGLNKESRNAKWVLRDSLLWKQRRTTLQNPYLCVVGSVNVHWVCVSE